MFISVLCENTAYAPQFQCEHGLSLYIEHNNKKILYDCGQSQLFIHNASKLNIDLSQIDDVIISHGHYDHGGGLAYLSQVNQKAKIYINKNAFCEYYSTSHEKPYEYIGLPQLDENIKKRIVLLDGTYSLNNQAFIVPASQPDPAFSVPFDGLWRKENGNYIPDSFSHEQCLLLCEEDIVVLVSGCSHNGILNILSSLSSWNITHMIGGFHFMNIPNLKNGTEILKTSAQHLYQSKIQFYTCHCTGLDSYHFMKPIMKDRLHYLSAGQTLSLS